MFAINSLRIHNSLRNIFQSGILNGMFGNYVLNLESGICRHLAFQPHMPWRLIVYIQVKGERAILTRA